MATYDIEDTCVVFEILAFWNLAILLNFLPIFMHKKNIWWKFLASLYWNLKTVIASVSNMFIGDLHLCTLYRLFLKNLFETNKQTNKKTPKIFLKSIPAATRWIKQMHTYTEKL